ARNLSLHTTFLKAFKQRIRVWLQRKTMPKIFVTCPEPCKSPFLGRPQLEIFVVRALPSQQTQHLTQFPVVARQRIRVVGKRESDQTTSRQPAINVTKDLCTAELLLLRGVCRVYDRLVPIGLTQGLQPGTRVEDRGVGMPLDQAFPPLIPQGIDLVQNRQLCLRTAY